MRVAINIEKLFILRVGRVNGKLGFLLKETVDLGGENRWKVVKMTKCKKCAKIAENA